jgi:hypothetical protein
LLAVSVSLQIEGGKHAMIKKPFVVPTLTEEASFADLTQGVNVSDGGIPPLRDT